MRYCSQCGQAITAADKFCSNCGAELRVPASDGGEEDHRQQQSRRDEAAQHATAAHPDPAPPEPKVQGKGGLNFWIILLALGWLFYSSGLLGVVAGQYSYSQDFLQKAVGQADWWSFGLMIGIPLAISILRPLLDIVIWPLQIVKAFLPGRLIVGIGLLSPFVVAWVLYDIYGISEYEFLHYSLVIGILVSYAIVRIPRGSHQ